MGAARNKDPCTELLLYCFDFSLQSVAVGTGNCHKHHNHHHQHKKQQHDFNIINHTLVKKVKKLHHAPLQSLWGIPVLWEILPFFANIVALIFVIICGNIFANIAWYHYLFHHCIDFGHSARDLISYLRSFFSSRLLDKIQHGNKTYSAQVFRFSNWQWLSFINFNEVNVAEVWFRIFTWNCCSLETDTDGNRQVEAKQAKEKVNDRGLASRGHDNFSAGFRWRWLR